MKSKINIDLNSKTEFTGTAIALQENEWLVFVNLGAVKNQLHVCLVKDDTYDIPIKHNTEKAARYFIEKNKMQYFECDPSQWEFFCGWDDEGEPSFLIYNDEEQKKQLCKYFAELRRKAAETVEKNCNTCRHLDNKMNDGFVYCNKNGYRMGHTLNKCRGWDPKGDKV